MQKTKNIIYKKNEIAQSSTFRSNNQNKKSNNEPHLNLISQIYFKKKNQKGLIINNNTFIDYKNKFKQTSLNISASLGLKKITLQLIKNKANLENQDYKGKTPLHNSIEKQNSEISKMLLFSKTRSDIQDKDKNTALHFTCIYNNFK